ncbi:glycosyl transferase [Fodinibacter luteus]|uniref:Glycosyl transferase n=1 Tax=Fodinibacter luteus TaxID=552064 RepID=A0ABP8KQC6_9MICO
MTWAVALAVLAGGVLVAVAWLLARPRPVGGFWEDPEPGGVPRPGDGFASQLRGYRMDQVDTVVDVLEARLAEHDRDIARRRGDPRGAPAAGAAPVGPPPAEEPPPPRPGPAALHEEVRAAGRPVPLRRSDLLAPATYLLLATWLLSGLIADLRTGYLSQGVQDQQAFEWYFGATAHNLVTLANPLFSDLQNFPAGVNLMANASMLGLGVPLAPLTLMAGPSATFLVVELLGLALTASAWFWLFRRRLAVHPLLAALGAGLAGFAPGMVAHANGHPNFVAQALVPVMVDRVVRIAEGRRPVRDGVALGLLAAWQVFIGEEVLLLTAIGVGLGGAVLLAHGLGDPRALARGVATGAGVCLAVVAVPLWWQFAGPQSYTALWHPPAGNDLAQLWGRATRSLGADPWQAAALSMNRTEENSFFGVPLLVAALSVVVVLWRRPLVRALGVVVVVSLWLSLGEEVVLHGRATGIPGPWALLEQLPVVENVLPTRLALVAVPALGALLALGLEEVRRAAGQYAAHEAAGLGVAALAAALVLLPVVPTPLVVEPRAAVPTFFSDGSWREWVDDGGSVLAAPAPWVGDARALEWQAQARWGFPLVAGYFVGPGTTAERRGQYGATPTALTQWMAEVVESGAVATADEAQRRQFGRDLDAGRVDAIVLPDSHPAAPALLASLTGVFGAPVGTGGVHVWDVRSLTDDAR